MGAFKRIKLKTWTKVTEKKTTEEISESNGVAAAAGGGLRAFTTRTTIFGVDTAIFGLNICLVLVFLILPGSRGSRIV